MLYYKKSAAVLRFLAVIYGGQREDKIGRGTVRHVFSSVLRVFTPRIKLAALGPEPRRNNQDPMGVKTADILRLIHQCVKLELRHHMRMIFDKLDTFVDGAVCNHI